MIPKDFHCSLPLRVDKVNGRTPLHTGVGTKRENEKMIRICIFLCKGKCAMRWKLISRFTIKEGKSLTYTVPYNGAKDQNSQKNSWEIRILSPYKLVT